MLKRFRRSAAGYDEQLPSDIRTPKTLLQTTNYLIRYVVGGDEPLGIIHKFVWDRTRSVRNDFSVQQLTQESDVKIAVTCLERIARFHIVSLHLLSSPANEEPFDRHQEREQLNNTMLSLMYYYDDNRERIHFPNEEEFRAYYIIFSIHDQRPDLEARVQKWPASLLNSPRVQVALDLYAASCNTWDYQGTLDARRPNAIAQGFYTRFFNIINSPSVSYLMACVAEIYFNHVRQTAIRAIWKGYCRQPVSQQHKNEEWTVEELATVLHFDDEDQTIRFCEEQGLELAENANGQLYLNWGNRPVDSVGTYYGPWVSSLTILTRSPRLTLFIAFQPSSEHAFSDMYVETKRAGRTLVAVILGLSVREAARMGMIDESILRSRVKEDFQEVSPADNELFVSDKDNQLPAPVVDMVSPPLDSEHPDSDSSAPGIRNPFQNAHPPASVNPFAKAQTAMPAAENPPHTFQTSQPPNPFASIFSNTATPSTAPATTTPAPNPFAPSKAKTPSPFTPSPSPFASSTPDVAPKHEAPAAATFATQPSSIFPTNGSLAQSPQPATAKPNPFAASVASFTQNKPFMASTNEEPPAATVGQPSSLFSGGSFTSTTSTPSAAKPNPFAASLSTFVPPKPTTANQAPVSEAPSILFPTAKPFSPSASAEAATTDTAAKPPSQFAFAKPAPATTSSSIFSFSKTASASQAEEKTSSVTATAATSQPSPFAGFKQTPSVASQPPAPAQNNIGGAFPTPSLSLTEKPSPAPPTFGPPATTSNAPQPWQPLFPNANATAKPSTQPQVVKAQPVETSLPVQPTQPETTTPAGSPEPVPVEIEEKVIEPEPPAESEPFAVPPIPAAVDQPAPTKRISAPPFDPYKTPEERKAAWERFIQRRKREVLEQEQARSRKRALEAPAAIESVQEEPGPKVAKVAETKEPTPPPKYSLVKSYLDSLPKLPCLERTRELLERKQPTEEEKEAAKLPNRQVDEDELLLNAARIAAEQLRTGPKIFDGIPPYSEPRRYSYSPRTSFGTPTPYTQSASPPPHGYQVAYAPDTPVGLGRTMSRTEQRIRATGGHGLAYKPLDFSRKGEKNQKRDGFTRSG